MQEELAAHCIPWLFPYPADKDALKLDANANLAMATRLQFTIACTRAAPRTQETWIGQLHTLQCDENGRETVGRGEET